MLAEEVEVQVLAEETEEMATEEVEAQILASSLHALRTLYVSTTATITFFSCFGASYHILKLY